MNLKILRLLPLLLLMGLALASATSCGHGSKQQQESVGIRVLDNIIRTLNENGVFAEREYTFQTFRQKFLDECAGVFTNVALSVPVSDLCEETYADFNNDFNVDFAIGGDGVKIY